ncbi:MAG: NAD(P)-dependent oxidoreductase [Anaerolineae bacterium]|nr:NAD(P)-dependent oxidoreductase [Anaerolineae bacterium]
MAVDTFFVTGAMGCIGAWTLRRLVRAGVRVVAFDLSGDPRRLRLLMDDDELAQITFVRGDITDLEQVKLLIERYGVTHVIHLAALQVPACKADPSLGARVNVVGAANVFEAVRQSETRSAGRVRGLAYASSVAALGPTSFYDHFPLPDDAPLRPDTLYGAFKLADEHLARVYWQDWQVGSVGLRPYIVYGVGRDQGMTSDLPQAILAAARGKPYHIRFGGPVALQYADDVAQMFIGAARAEYCGAMALNIRNDVIDVGEFVRLLKVMVPGAQITYEPDSALPFPANLDDRGLRGLLGEVPHTPLEQAIGETLEMFRALSAKGQIESV